MPRQNVQGKCLFFSVDLLKQVALLGHHQGAGGTGALLALVGTKVGAPKAAGAGDPQWSPGGGLMWHYLCWVPLVGCSRPKWWCVGSGAQVHCWLLWPPRLVHPKLQVLGSPSGPWPVCPCGTTSTGCHQWGMPGPNGSVWPPGGRGAQQQCCHLWLSWVICPKQQVLGSPNRAHGVSPCGATSPGCQQCMCLPCPRPTMPQRAAKCGLLGC